MDSLENILDLSLWLRTFPIYPNIIKRLNFYTEKNIIKLTASKSDHISQCYYIFQILSEWGNKMEAPQIIAGIGKVQYERKEGNTNERGQLSICPQTSLSSIINSQH